MLMKSYQSMRASDFEKFVSYFLEQNRDVNARNPDDESVLDIVRQHHNSGEFAKILTVAGAE